jgi:hypothetical protein
MNLISIFLRGFLLGVGSLSSFYYLLLAIIAKDFTHPFEQFLLFGPWMGVLVIGFGVQLGLFWLMRHGVRFSLKEKSDAKMAAGTGTVLSGSAMVACCAHHAVEILPILGASAVALFLTEYQEQFIYLGVFSNLLGITIMLWYLADKPKALDIIKFAKNGSKV